MQERRCDQSPQAIDIAWYYAVASQVQREKQVDEIDQPKESYTCQDNFDIFPYPHFVDPGDKQ